mgnify:CR=1 FL=1
MSRDDENFFLFPARICRSHPDILNCFCICQNFWEDHHPIIGNFPCTGMHGGKLFLRGDCRNLKFPPQVTADIASFEDLQGIMDDLKEYCSDFHYDLKTILSSPFTLVTPNSKNPYKQMYVAN